MSGTYVTDTGLVVPSLLDIKGDLETAWQGVFGASVDLGAQSPNGQIIGTFAERLSDAWDALQEVYASQDPDESTGQSQDSVCAVTGTVRKSQTYSEVTIYVGGRSGLTLQAGQQVSVDATGIKFQTLAAVVLSGAADTINGVYCAATATVMAQALNPGALPALAGHLTVIETPVDGWLAVTNPADAITGDLVETDPALRLRREQELRQPANAALEAIRTALINVSHVRSAVVFENTTDVTNAYSQPPHSVECVVLTDGTSIDPAIRAAIFGSVGAGLAIYGSDDGSVTDSQGIVHDVPYSPAEQLTVYQTWTVTVDPTVFPTDGIALITASLMAYGKALPMGKDVKLLALASRIFTADPLTLAPTGGVDPRAGLPIPGVLDLTGAIGTSWPPAGGAISVGLRQLAVIQTGTDGSGHSYLAVATIPGTP